MLSPILIDGYYPIRINNSNVSFETQSVIHNSHLYFTALSFTKFDINVHVIPTNFTEDSVHSILLNILKSDIKNPVFMPFGSSAVSTRIDQLMYNFSKDQLYCSFNNISDHCNFPGIHPNVTPISSMDLTGKCYFKYCDVDMQWYRLVSPIKIISQLLKDNSFILGDFYAFGYASKINIQKEITMPIWNFNNLHEFEVKSNELFGFLITSAPNAVAENLPQGITFRDGFLLGHTNKIVDICITAGSETQTFTINPIKKNNYEFSILSKKF